MTFQKFMDGISNIINDTTDLIIIKGKDAFNLKLDQTQQYKDYIVSKFIIISQSSILVTLEQSEIKTTPLEDKIQDLERRIKQLERSQWAYLSYPSTANRYDWTTWPPAPPTITISPPTIDPTKTNNEPKC